VSTTFSIGGVPIRLPEERWRHIREKHPEIEYQEQVLQAVSSPDLIQSGDSGALMAIRRLDTIYLVVIYREVTTTDGFVITAYLAERLRGRATLWSR
jgi:hypothetical protein